MSGYVRTCLYEVLGVERNATDDEIKKAYRKIALKTHPDRNPGDAVAESAFKEAAEAYEVLADDEKRARYDQFGHAGPSMGFGGGGAGFSNAADIFSFCCTSLLNITFSAGIVF